MALAMIIVVLLISLVAAADDSSICNRTCGTNGSAKQVDYPFGFSTGCPIQLKCTNTTGAIEIGTFHVRNISQSSILVDFPKKCNRSIDSIRPLFGSNFSPTRTNGLILQTCKTPLNGCYESMWFKDDQFGNCSGNYARNNISCFSSISTASRGVEVIGFDDLKETNCEFILSSIAPVDGDLMRLNAVQLGWWLKGHSRDLCARNSSFETVALGNNGTNGIRCKCNVGFEGDGFANGTGCRQDFSGCSGFNYFSSNCFRTHKLGILIGGIAAGSFLLSSLLVICFLIRRNSTCLRNRTMAGHLMCAAAGIKGVPIYRYKDIERATNGFSERQRLGNGAYGIVYAGRLHDDEIVAIKRIRHRDAQSIKQLVNEIKLISSVSHPNLVQLRGCCIENGEQILVYEYMPNGTLSQHLTRERRSRMPWTVRLRIATETARAIAYLHSEMNPPIFHRDIKSNNILLDFQYRSKVADFGLSRLGMTEANDSHISTAPQGTPGYLDPQYHQQFHLSDKSDVYSFGVVLVEIITALKVVDFSRSNSEVTLAAMALDRIGRGCLDEIIDPSIDQHRDAWTLSSIHKVAELAFRCLSYHQDMRPSMSEVAQELELIRLSAWAIPEDTITRMGSSVASSSCSTPIMRCEKYLGNSISAKTGAGSQRSSIRRNDIRPSSSSSAGKSKDKTYIPAHEHQLSDSSRSPSANPLLRNTVP